MEQRKNRDFRHQGCLEPNANFSTLQLAVLSVKTYLCAMSSVGLVSVLRNLLDCSILSLISLAWDAFLGSFRQVFVPAGSDF